MKIWVLFNIPHQTYKKWSLVGKGLWEQSEFIHYLFIEIYFELISTNNMKYFGTDQKLRKPLDINNL